MTLPQRIASCIHTGSRIARIGILVFICFQGGNGQEPSPLFICETSQNGKYLAIYGVEHGPDDPWTDIQYRFGGEGEPDMVYPADPAKGAGLLFFSHEYRKGGADYYVSIRFSTGGFTYRIFSHSRIGGAGVVVSDAKGKVRSTIPCIEKPYMFPSYLQRSLACDLRNPHGKAACQDAPYRPPGKR
jgi:hypothetical protein